MKKNGLMRRIAAAVVALLAPAIMFSCGKTNFLGSGENLSVVKLPYFIDPDDLNDPGNTGSFHELFDLAPGTVAPKASYVGGADPLIGTSIIDDFDADGIPNQNETINNIWVADYPVVEATVVPPITMQIEIIDDVTMKTESFSSEISSDDMESNIEQGTEAVHRNEVNTKTVQFQDTFNTSGSASISASMNMAMSANVNVMGSGAGASYSMGSSVSTSLSHAYGETKNKWKDVPFKDNLGRDSKSLKRTEAAKNSRNLRSELRKSVTATTRIKPDAGYIRAALYIRNYSVNMPVKLSNILCSFMLETPAGDLLPVQSFELRKEDYSLFEVELYGDTMFGPYVISLKGLNTAEIKDAIAKGYNPKIFIVKYNMTHVADSNYKTFLGDRFTGSNLMIIEERAKGRTAGIKLVGPGFRHFFRVAAFSVLDAANEPMNEGRVEPQPDAVTSFSPGVSLEKALTRISYSGIEIECEDYVLDFTGIGNLQIPKDPANPELGYYDTPRFHVRSVKSINGKKTTLPGQLVENSDGTKTFIMKPLGEWSDAEKIKCGLWVIFDQGRYYRHPEDFGKNPLLNGLNVGSEYTYSDPYITGGPEVTVPKVQGITGCIWPGDHYDIVYVTMAELLGIPDEVMDNLIGMDDTEITLDDILEQTGEAEIEKKEFGYNPIENEEITLDFNTSWKSEELGERPFIPNVNSQYLGTAIEGDLVELVIQLNKTKYLNPSFGTPIIGGSSSTYIDFVYNMLMSTAVYPFDLEEALDFEISFAINGRQGDWMNLVPVRSPYTETYWNGLKQTEGIEYSWDYLDQNFVVRFSVPEELPGIGLDGVVDIYLRTAPNSAYRESIWPLRHDQVKQFRGRVVSYSYNIGTNQTTLSTEYSSGQIAVGDDLHVNIDTTLYDVISAAYDDEQKQYQIVVAGDAYAKKGDWAMVDLSSALADPEMQISIDDDFFAQWNDEVSDLSPERRPLLTGNSNTEFTPVRSLGYQPDYIVGNWLGNNNFGNPFWNNWADAGTWDTFLNRSFYPFLSTASGYNFNIIPLGFESVPYNDYIISTSNTGEQNLPQVVVSGDRALMVWQSGDNGVDDDIRGRFMDVSTGEFFGEDFLVSTTNAYDQQFPKLCISGDKVLIVWQSNMGTNWDIRGRFLNMSTREFSGDDIRINAVYLYDQDQPEISVSGDLALAVWHYNTGLRCRLLDMSTEGFASNELILDTTTAGLQCDPEIGVSGDRALVVWQSYDNGADYDIRGRFLTMSAGSFDGNDFLVSTTNTESQTIPKVDISGDSALVVWRSDDNGVDDDIRGRLLNMSTGAFVGDDFLVSTSNNGLQILHQVGVSGDRALVVWASDNDLRGRFMNISTGSFLGSDFLINTTSAYCNNWPQISISGDRALVVWQSYYNTRGRLIQMSTESLLGNDFLVNSSKSTYLGLEISGDRALVVLPSTTSDICGSIIDMSLSGNYLEHGLSNFFVSPMIERDYTVRVRMIDPLSE
ncbi:MAG: hypothetical protein JW807_14795 [Spirochaetes bacterium]|nr:hypothetical protein [Spirochaetota bacterium]